MSPTTAAGARGASVLPDFVQRQFERGAEASDHRQLYSILQRGIREGRLAAGARLPPTRALAAALGIARNTVVGVYEQLILEGYLAAGVGRGTFVMGHAAPLDAVATGNPQPGAAPPPGQPALPPHDRGDRIAAAAPARSGARDASAARRAPLSRRAAATLRGASAGSIQWGAFTPGVPEVRLFPTAVWNRLHARAWAQAAPRQLSYATGAGEPALREVVAEYLQGTRGVVCDASQIVITSGIHQSLHLLAQLLCDVGDAVWLEDPGYWGARSIFRAHGLELVPVPVDVDGLAPTPPQLRRPPRMIMVSPSHQYPTGALMSHGRRMQLLDYAAARRCWVLEDDYDSEFRYRSRPLPALQGLDRHGRVIYLGTFSKTLFPSLRLAYAVLPPELVEPFTRLLGELFREGQSMQQAVLASFLAEGHYARHIRRLRLVYAARHDALVRAIERELGPAWPVLGGDAGLHLLLGLPPGCDDAALATAIQARGVTTRPLSLYHLSRRGAARGLLLGYGAVDDERIAGAFAVVAAEVRQAVARLHG